MIGFTLRTVLAALFLAILTGEQEFSLAVDGSPNGLFLITTFASSRGSTKATNSTTHSTESITGTTIESKPGDGYLPLHKAAMQGNYQKVSDLALRTNIDQRTHSGKTALHLMVLTDERNMVENLLRLGASVEIKDDKEKMPIDYWEPGNDVRILRMLQACEKPPTPDCPRSAK